MIDRYYQTTWSSAPMVVASEPYDLASLTRWAATGAPAVIGDLSGGELLFVRTAKANGR